MESLFRDKDWHWCLVDVVLSIPKILGFVVVCRGVNDMRLRVEWTSCRLGSICQVSSGIPWNDGIGQSCIRMSFAVRVVGDGASTLLEVIRAELRVESQARTTAYFRPRPSSKTGILSFLSFSISSW
jgi:hypothetical protein